jgi:putative ABC transport system permease protein
VGFALGALEREVLLQFLVEAVTLSLVGRVVDFLLATAASLACDKCTKDSYLFTVNAS